MDLFGGIVKKAIIFLISIVLIIFVWLSVLTVIPIINQPQVLSTTTNLAKTIEENVIFNFDTNNIDKGNQITHETGSTDIRLEKKGIYEVSYTVCGGIAEGGTPACFNVFLCQDGKLVSDQTVTPLLQAGEKNTLTQTQYITVDKHGSTIQLHGQSIGNPEYYYANITVQKIH